MIGDKTRQRTIDMINGLLCDHDIIINNAYMKHNKELPISISIKYTLGGGGGTDIAVTINFIGERIKQQVRSNVVENQKDLPFPQK